MERKQFTFYRSFFEAVSRIRRKSVRADVYDAICCFALNGEKPTLEGLPREAEVAMMLIFPILESGNNKAMNRLKTNEEQNENKTKSNQNQNDNKGKCKLEDKLKDKYKSECKSNSGEAETVGGDTADFDLFWAEYPKKVGKQAALKAFEKVTVPVDTLIRAVRQQRNSEQWTRENGRFIPNPATWLGQQRWEDELPPPKGVPKGATGVLGKEELESIQRMLKES